MRLHLEGLKDGTHQRDWSGQVEGVDLIYPEIPASVQVRAKVHRLRDVITVRGQVRARLDRACDRCLKPACLGLEAALYVIIRQSTVGVAPEEGDEGEALLTVAFEQQEVDLTGQIRDALVVEVPMVVTCTEGCKGLCHRCGADLNNGPCSCPPEQDEPRAGRRMAEPEWAQPRE